MPWKMFQSTVNVAVRIRPLALRELENGSKTCVAVVGRKQKIQVANAKKSYRFDYVFGPEVNNERFYNTAISNRVAEVLNERDVTILAYGQRTSGKTHTMGTNYTGEENVGVIPRALDTLFDIIDADSDHIYKVTITFVELYNKELYDLLAPDKKGKERIVEIKNDGSKVLGLIEKQIMNAKDALRYLVQGSQERATSEKRANSQSSRSHAIFTISIHKQKNNDLTNSIVSKLHLVDLAGSKHGKKAGKRTKEIINKDLLALGNLINQVRKGKSDSCTGYKDSKLGIFLRDSPRGISTTLIIACVSPAYCYLIETLDTLRYANRLRRMRNEIIEQERERERNEIAREMNTNLITAKPNLENLVEVQQSTSTSLTSQDSCESSTTERNKFQRATFEYSASNFFPKIADSVFGPSPTKQKELQEEIHNLEKKLAVLSEKRQERTKSAVIKLLKGFQEVFSNIAESSEVRDWTIRFYRKIHDLLNEPEEVTEKMLKCKVFEGESMVEEYAGHVMRDVEKYHELQDVNRCIVLLEKLVISLLKVSTPIGELRKDSEDTYNEIKVLETEKESFVQLLKNPESNNKNRKLTEFRITKIQELNDKISKSWGKRIKQTMIIETKERFDRQIVKISAQIKTLTNTRVRLAGIMKHARKQLKPASLSGEEKKRDNKAGTKKAKKNSNVQQNSLKGSLRGVIKCACKVLQCLSQGCSCFKNGTSCTNCNCNAELCQNSDKENNVNTVSVKSHALSKISADSDLKRNCKIKCLAEKCMYRKGGAIYNDDYKRNLDFCENKDKENDTTKKSFIQLQASKRSTDNTMKIDCAARCLPINLCMCYENGASCNNCNRSPKLRDYKAKENVRRRLFADIELPYRNEENEESRKRPRLDT